jgi:hypothetical protein
MLNKLGIYALASQVAPKLFQARLRTWIGIGVGLLALLGLLIWVAIALLGWIFGQAQGWSATATEEARGALATVERQVEQMAPGARDKAAEYVSFLKARERPLREVSGTDLAPVARFPGLVRTYWHREGKIVSTHYEGRADYEVVLSHYLQGFVALGYTQELQSATPEAESHVWSKGQQRFLVKIVRTPKVGVSVQIETPLE